LDLRFTWNKSKIRQVTILKNPYVKRFFVNQDIYPEPFGTSITLSTGVQFGRLLDVPFDGDLSKTYQ
jgi:hypothetical protein